MRKDEMFSECAEYWCIWDGERVFHIEDMGENYLIPRKFTKEEEIDLIEYFSSFGYRCEILNEFYLNIKKEKVE